MTYCVAMRLSAGLVFVSDSRTNAGVDHISTFRKLHVFKKEGERVLVIQSSGNLATTQAVIKLLAQRCKDPDQPNLLTVETMDAAAALVGDATREIVQRDSSAQQTARNTDFSCNLLFGGQIKGGDAALFNIYPQGNFIETSVETPYFQIGESKYGKPIIDRVLHIGLPLDQAMQCALISMDSTLRSNLSVGLPLDVMIYPVNSFDSTQQCRITESHPYFSALRKVWSESLVKSFEQLPTLQLKP